MSILLLKCRKIIDFSQTFLPSTQKKVNCTSYCRAWKVDVSIPRIHQYFLPLFFGQWKLAFLPLFFGQQRHVSSPSMIQKIQYDFTIKFFCHLSQQKLFYHFCDHFIYCFFTEQYVHILSVGPSLCTLVHTSCIFIMYALNVSV